MSRDPPQRRSAARETALPLTARRPLVFDGVQGAQATARQGGASGTDAASLPLTLRHGMETRCPKGAGQRQRSWLCAKHDSPARTPGVGSHNRMAVSNQDQKYARNEEGKPAETGVLPLAISCSAGTGEKESPLTVIL
ncbi:Uncharacterised protein [Raoultella terrigena]|uniref:Uncharacterized protein n=1 Tax=Raoultella terrigena TaxID=577 RepID=A0A4U9DDM2_RAOTE|nr:Uncharacterised protein [Raoultella terrigena]